MKKRPRSQVVRRRSAKALHAGATPAVASKRPGGGIGRHEGLKIPWMKVRAGSTPALGILLLINKIMLSQLPINLDKVKKEDIDKEILRAGMIAELDAVSFYEQMAAMTENEDIKKVLLDIAKEEKTHIAEFEAMLLKIDEEQVLENEAGKKEVKELTG